MNVKDTLNHRIVFTKPGRAVLESCPLTEPGPGEVQVRMCYTALSAGTERAFLLGEPNTGGAFPRYLGYSASGVVTAVGPEVTAFAPGQRVIAYHGRHQAAANLPVERVATVPEGVELLDACMTEIACMGLQGVRKLRVELGESGMVIGLGLLGLFAVQAMRASGASPVIAVDFSEARRSLALKLGAQHAFSPDDPRLDQRVREATRGRGVSACVEVSGAEDALRLALRLAAPEGRISLTGCTRVYRQPVDFYQLVHKPGVTLIGAHNAVRPSAESRPGYWTRKDDEQAFLELVRDGRMDARSLIGEVVSPSDCESVYQRLTDGTLKLGTVFKWNEPE